MKFRVERDVLSEAVAWTARSIPVRPMAPMLAGLLIETADSGDGLILSAFNEETSARASISAQVVEEGRALVSGRLLTEICKSLPNKAIEISIDGTKLVLVCGSSKFTLQTLPVEEYPALPAMPQAAGTVSSDAFAQAVSQAVTAAGNDQLLQVLTGVRIEIEGSSISLLATDRFRLSLRELSWDPAVTDVSAAALVPARVLAETAKSLTAGSRVSIALSGSGSGDGLIGFEGEVAGGFRRTTTRLIAGEFPRVRTLFPAEHATVVRMSRGDLVDAVKRVSLVADRASGVVQLKFDDNGLTLDAGSGEEALATELIEAQVKGEPITAGFNPGYLLDGLGALDHAFVELAFTQAPKPVVITGLKEIDSERDVDFQYLLMPRRMLN